MIGYLDDSNYRDVLLRLTPLFDDDIDVLEAVTQKYGISMQELFRDAVNSMNEQQKQGQTVFSDTIIDYMFNNIEAMVQSAFDELEDNDYIIELVGKAQEIISRVFYESN